MAAGSKTPVEILETNNDVMERKRAGTLLAGEKRILEMLARGNPLAQMLESLCLLIEEQAWRKGCVLAGRHRSCPPPAP
jgi:hypothetical protein